MFFQLFRVFLTKSRKTHSPIFPTFPPVRSGNSADCGPVGVVGPHICRTNGGVPGVWGGGGSGETGPCSGQSTVSSCTDVNGTLREALRP